MNKIIYIYQILFKRLTKKLEKRMKAKSIYSVLLLVVVSATLFFACQSKEVTSAKVYIQQNNWDKAIEQLEMAIKAYPNDAEAYYLLGEGYGNQGRWKEMNEMFNKSLELSPKFATQIKNSREKYWVNNFNSGVNRISGGDVKGAIKQFKICLEIEPERIEAYRNLAVAYIRADSLEKAKEVFDKALELKPDDRDLLLAAAQINFTLKNYAAVVDLMKKLLEQNPEDKDAIVNLALAYDYLGEKEKAMQEYRNALEKNPNDKDLLFNLGRLYYLNHDYDKAIELFRKVTELNPDDYDSNLNVGNAYLSMGDNYRKQLVAKEDKGETVTKEEVAKLKSFYEKAIPYLEKALSIKNDDPNAWNNLGVAYVNIGNAEKGKECFDKADSLKK